MQHLSIAADLARSLYHGCAPAEGGTYSSVEELHAAMEAAADAYDEHMSIPCTRWQYEDGHLRHETVTGRMRLEADPDVLAVRLYSPSHMGGAWSYLTLYVRDDGSVDLHLDTYDERAALDLIRAKPERIDHLLRYVAPLVGLGRLLDAMPAELRAIAVEYGAARAREQIAGLEAYPPGPGGYSEEYHASLLDLARCDLRAYERYAEAA